MGRESLKTMLQLATTAFGLVAALAWNEAIKALFARIFGQNSGLVWLFVYAVAVTIIVTIVTSKLSKLAEKTDLEKKE